VTCIGPKNINSEMAYISSSLFSTNVAKLIMSMEKKTSTGSGKEKVTTTEFAVDEADAAVRSMLVVHDGNKLAPYVPPPTPPEEKKPEKAVVVVDQQQVWVLFSLFFKTRALYPHFFPLRCAKLRPRPWLSTEGLASEHSCLLPSCKPSPSPCGWEARCDIFSIFPRCTILLSEKKLKISLHKHFRNAHARERLDKSLRLCEEWHIRCTLPSCPLPTPSVE